MTASPTELLQRLARLPGAEARRELERLVRDELAEFLGFGGAGEIDPSEGFAELGFDSLMAVDFKTVLEKKLLATLRTTLLFDHPSPRELASFLADEVLHLDGPASAAAGGPDARAAADSAAGPAEDLGALSEEELRVLLARRSARLARLEATLHEPIAIVGMGCRLPGGVTNPASLWELLAAGRDAITEVPPERWDAEGLFDPEPNTPGKSYSRWGGFLEHVDRFDAAFFRMNAARGRRADRPGSSESSSSVAWEALERRGLGVRPIATPGLASECLRQACSAQRST